MASYHKPPPPCDICGLVPAVVKRPYVVCSDSAKPKCVPKIIFLCKGCLDEDNDQTELFKVKFPGELPS